MMHKDHIKIFDLNLDLSQIKKDCGRSYQQIIKEYGHIEENDSYPRNTVSQIKELEQLAQAPVSTKLNDFYNLFSFYYKGIYDVYQESVRIFKEVREYQHLYYLSAWVNYQTQGQSIPWHNHWYNLSRNLNNVYIATCYIDAEPSVTTYEFDNGYVERQTIKNNTFTIYEDVGDRHSTDVWQQDYPRISISMEFVPIQHLWRAEFPLNTWIPV
jgi:hypothetical protein